MFVGHLALGFAARRRAPEIPLAWLMAAVTLADLVWPIFVLTGVERVRIVPGATAFNPLVFDSYPWSHSLVMLIGWGVVLALLGRLRGLSARAGWILALLVLSHWLLDFISHAPDLPLWPGVSPHLGLGLWNSVPATFLAEGAMWVTGLALYLHGRHRVNRAGPLALWSLVGVCTLMWASGPWAPPPPGVEALGWFALIGWIILPWAAVADRNYALAPATS
jgi:hypothetical protein